MKFVGYAFYGLAAIDMLSYSVIGIDFTGVSWSPIVLALIGTAVLNVAGK